MTSLLNPFVFAGGSPPPSDAINFDFIAGTYYVNGVAKTAADVVDQPSWIDGTGLVIADFASSVAILGDALTYLLTADWTMVIEWDHFTSANTILPFVMADGSNDNAVQLKRNNGLGGHLMNVQDFAGINFRQATDVLLGAVGDGVHKTALTRTDPKLIFSTDGSATVADTSISFGIVPIAAAFGGYPGDTIGDALTIRRFTANAPVSDGSLPGLST
jgi:hypothetical protein